MVRYTLGLALLAGVLALALCLPASAVDIAPDWLDEISTNGYFWTNWGGTTQYGTYAALPDVTVGTGSAIATVTIADSGAGLQNGVSYGSRDTVLDLGPGGNIHLDLTTYKSGLYIYTKVLYHVDITSAPIVTASNAALIASNTTLVEDTSLDPSIPSGWTLGEYLWKVESADVGMFTGIDIVADANTGAIIEQVSAQTHLVPEPAGLLALATGVIAMIGITRRRSS